MGKVNKTNTMLPNLVDNVTGDENISKLFATKYDKLYNSVAYNEEDVSSLLQNMHSQIDAQCNDCENIVTVQDILKGINQVKSNKYDGYGLFYTDHFIHATHKLHVFLSLCYSRQMVNDWYTPDGFHMATIQYLVQNKRKSANDYRAIALCSHLSKLFD